MQQVTDTLILPPDLAVDGTLGQYVLVREAGRGGMSVVHEARHLETGRTVAVKVLAVPPGLPPAQAEDMRARFAREARAVAGLSHPNIVALHGLGEHGGRHFLVMEYLRGETLRQRLGRGPLTPAQALPVLRQVAAAVDAVHARGVVHRDVKPSNVMLLPDGTAKLLDFGVARRHDDATLTGTGALVGSPAYMAPEQVRGGAATPASDLWALGALLYEALAGRPPFTGDNIPSVLYRVSHEDPAPVAGLTAPVQRVLRRALDKNPARRYPTARALAESLAAAVSPPRPPLPSRLGGAAALAMIALVGLGVVFLRPRPLPPPAGVSASPALAVPFALPLARPRDKAATPPETRPQITRGYSKESAPAVRRARRPAPSHPTPKRVHTHRSRRKAVAAARRPRRAVFRPLAASARIVRAAPQTRHQKADDFDAAASARLQKFIWAEGR